MNAGARKIALSHPALQVDCPTCTAKVGQRCRKIRGDSSGDERAPHKERKFVADCARSLKESSPEPTLKDVARKALMALPPEERRDLIAELAPCTCRAITTVVRDAPEIGIGALVGGLAGLAIKLFKKDESK